LENAPAATISTAWSTRPDAAPTISTLQPAPGRLVEPGWPDRGIQGMDSVDLEVMRSAVAWLEAGHGATIGTVTRTWGSAPRPVGAMLVIRDDGHVMGSVSGGCVEDDLIEKVKAHKLAAGKPAVTTYGITNEEATRWGLPCGGTLQIVLEPVSRDAKLKELLEIIERHELVARFLDMDTGAVRLEPGKWSDALEFDGKVLKTVHGPRWRLLLIGAGQTSRYVAQMAMALDYHVTVCDPREEYAEEWNLPGATLVRGYPDDTVVQMNPDAHMAVVAVTHDPKLDDAALLEALKSPCFYVGALGSRKNNDARRKRLAGFDLSAGEIGKLRGPVGLKIGAKTPPEIAVAILAEMTAVRRGVAVPALEQPADPNVVAGCEVTER
jgi:xanthine dehydrogenase accessory factor